MAQLAAGTRKGTKRAAAGPSPASPPVGKKKKKGGKKANKPKKVKAANPHKKGRSGAVSDSNLFNMQLVAGRHGWSVGDPPAPASQGLAQAALHPATSAPPPVPPAGQAALYPTTMAPPAGQAALYSMTTALPPVFPAGQQPSLFPPPPPPHTGPQQHWEHRPGKSNFFSRHRHPPCPRTFLPSRRAPLSRRRLTQTGPLYRDPPPWTRTCGR